MRRRALDAAIALSFGALLLMSITVYRDDLAGRARTREFVTKYELDLRRPHMARTIEYIPAPDWAAELIADSALQDTYETVNLLDASPRMREAWIDAAAHTDDELRDARTALLDAIQQRPGWPYCQLLLGQTTFAMQSRSFSSDLVEKSAMWAVPMLYAARDAKTASEMWRALASGYLQTWPVLAAVHRPTAPEVFRNAFAETYFVHIGFADAARLLGSDEALGYVPDVPTSLRAAFDVFAKNDDTARAFQVFQRWERSEWQSRARDLAKIEAAARIGDADLVAATINQWLPMHDVRQFDTAGAHAQVARVIDLWPSRPRGPWASDLLADAARYLLTRNGESTRFGRVIVRRLPDFTGVPAPTVAELRLAAGDVTGAERVALSADGRDAEAWAHYTFALARERARTGGAAAAATVLARLPESLQDTPEAAIVRGESPGGDPVAPVCGADVSIPVRGALTSRTVNVHLTSESPSLVEIGINRARGMTVLLNGSRNVSVTLEGWPDKDLFVRAVSGGRNPCVAVSAP